MRTAMQTAILLALVTVAAAAHADPKADAKKLVAKQAAVLKDGDDAAFHALFAPDAVVIGAARSQAAKDVDPFYFRADLFGGSPHTELRKVKVVSVNAGGDAKRLWITAELSATAYIPEPEFGARTETISLRLSELAVDDGTGWKIVAAALDQPGSPAESSADVEVQPLPGSGPPTELTGLLTMPGLTAGALAGQPGAFVIGTDKGERGIGKGAVKLLTKWKKLALNASGPAREVRTATWGFAQAHLVWTRGSKLYRMDGLVIAIPNPDGTWTPVGLHYVHWSR